ncbi:glycosyltransferase family 4 protein [Aphanothece minutissima]|uniref:Glycosyltransferase family 1 protein n=1 Tax=Aphanothece cf. minutissima CCALA 015 TaxID=2107695 RepID=A0ABX5FCB2_9CHRO|nr:glycosyltransferase family 4 protein [Aphanothece minutissima]PSB39523.1 glycosyltransferase family 1 protein [Aphanothece cf. minutissima CCALA 015]
MRVAFAHYSQADDISGVTTWVLGLARRLAADGISVAIHFVMTPGEGGREGPGAGEGEPPLFETLRREGIAVFATPRRTSLAADARDTLAFLNHWRPTVFLPQCKPAHYAAAAQAGRRGLPWALTLHSDDPDYWATVGGFGGARQGSVLVCVSRHIHEACTARGIDRPARVIPYGVQVPEAVTEFRPDPFRVVFSGRIWEHQKRASLVIQALIRACRSHGALRATLIGDGYARPDCERQVAEAGLAGAIDFSGSLPPGEVKARLLDAQAILLMSDFEGLPIALLEAMAAGVVPVVRRIPSGIPELVEDGRTGLLVSEDPDEAARALRRLADDPALWRRCSTAARELVSTRYNADASYRLWRRLLEDLDQQGRAAPSSPYPVPCRRIEGLRGIPASFHREYRAPRSRSAALRQALRTAVARAKHRIRRVLGRRRGG